jgi:peptidoglycan/LPS O-acetylase OafA/YrhL
MEATPRAIATAAAPQAGRLAEAAPRAAGLTKLRFFFIAWVVLYHLDLALDVSAELPWLKPVLGRGYLGVDGFFLLSGFAMWLGYAARPPRDWPAVRQFLVRRLAKIWPLHALALLALALLVGLALASGIGIRAPERFNPRDLLLQLLLVNDWETMRAHAWNYPSWALSAEWAGYLAFPLLLGALLRLPARAVPAVVGGAFVGLCLLPYADPGAGLNLTLHLGLARFFLEFALGMALARWNPGRGLALATLALPLGLVLRLDPLVVAGLAALIALAWRWPSPARPDLLVRLGEASFGVYLCWIFVEAGLVGVLRLAEPGLGARICLLVLGFLLNLLAGWCAWRWVEVPLHHWVLKQLLPVPGRGFSPQQIADRLAGRS